MKDKLKFLSIYYIWVLIGIPLHYIVKYLKFDVNIPANQALIQFLVEILFVIILIIFYFKVYKKDTKEIFKNKKFLGEVIRVYVGVLVVQVSASILINNIGDALNLELGSSENNELVHSLLKSAPIMTAIGTIFMAPFYEEGIMRLSFKKGIKNKGVFVAFSGFIFGIMHVVDGLLLILTLPLMAFLIDYVWSKYKHRMILSATFIVTYACLIITTLYFVYGEFSAFIDVKELIYGILYVSVGKYFAYTYSKYNNIYYSISAHMISNVVATIFLYLT